MLGNLPIEIVGAVLQTAAELNLVSDRATVLNIIKSCSLGYTYTTPVLYRTLVIEDYNLVTPVFDESTPLASGLLSRPATERLCSQVRRLFLGRGVRMKALLIGRLFPQLQAMSTFEDMFTEENCGQLPPGLRSFYCGAVPQSQRIMSTVTHLMVYWDFSVFSVTDLKEWFGTCVSSNVTHVALEFNDISAANQEANFVEVLQYLLARDTVAPVAIRIYRDAMEASSLRMMLKVIGTLDATQIQRVLIWRDERSISNGYEDIEVSKWDAVYGRTPWTEATPVPQKELDAALHDIVQ